MKKIKYEKLLIIETIMGFFCLLSWGYIILLYGLLAITILPFAVLGVLVVFASQHRLRSFKEHKYLNNRLEDIEIKLNKILKGSRKK